MMKTYIFLRRTNKAEERTDLDYLKKKQTEHALTE